MEHFEEPMITERKKKILAFHENWKFHTAFEDPTSRTYLAQA
jgi:hypothetical protein